MVSVMKVGDAPSSDALESNDGEFEFSTKVRWTIPQRLNAMTFVGRDVLAVAHDIYISFLNFKTHAETVYVANNPTDGDGVDAIAGQRANIFAFAEKARNPRIFIISFPSFTNLAELQDTDVIRYKGLCMMECDLIAGFSGFPNYLVTIWNWRSGQRLLCLDTGVTRRDQIYMASRTHMLVCECWGGGLVVWEVAQCHKRTFMMRRAKEEVTGWEVSEPALVGLCWTNEGQLYAVDSKSNLYSICSDGIGMVSNLEWSENLTGRRKPNICSFANGLLIYGPDKFLRSLKKCESSWKVAWKYQVKDEVLRLISNSTSDVATMWTEKGMVYKITGESEEHIDVELFCFKQRNIQKVQLIAPDYQHVATIDNSGVLCIYEVLTAKLILMYYVEGNDVSFQASPVDPLLILFGEVNHNYGMVLMTFDPEEGLEKVGNKCLTHQIVSQIVFSPTGRELVAAAMSAGHIFIMLLSEQYELTLVRYMEIGRGLADCFLMKVGDAMRCFSLVLFSDKYLIGERIICTNVETGKDNKFAGKMQGPYARLLPLSTKDTMLGIPHLTKQFHVLKLAADKGVTVAVKMGPIINTGHDVKYFNGFLNVNALLTFGYDGTIILREPSAPEEYDLKIVATHRYESGIIQALIDEHNKYVVHLAGNRSVVLQYLNSKRPELKNDPKHESPDKDLFDEDENSVRIIGERDKNYLDLQEDKKVHEETMDYKKQREEVVAAFKDAQAKLIELLEENIAEQPLHQLSLSEFNLHMEHKKERLKQAEQERLEIRLQTEARIRAQDKVTAWIKSYCWDAMLAPRVKLFAIFSHYQVENYAVLPTQRENWPELQLIENLRSIEMEDDDDLFRPWEEIQPVEIEESQENLEPGMESTISVKDQPRKSQESQGLGEFVEAEEVLASSPYVLSGSNTHQFVAVPPFMIPQTLAFGFLQMNWLHHIVKLNVQNMRLWFNKEFNELMNLKKREVNLVEERNARLRFIIDELNKLSDLRGSFHHLIIQIKDPEWKQEEQPQKLIKVEPEECSIEPYISPSQIVIIPPDPGPKDDFRERALIEMMDGVLEKLWHEEIKKPIPMPQCMLDKDPEHFNEDDLRLVFEYEAAVAFRNEERDKYRKMLHQEYARLKQVLDEGIVKFNQKVKEMWLTKLKVDSVIGQENLNLMRLRRTNLDRVEQAEKLESMRELIAKCEAEIEDLQQELSLIQEQGDECQAAYDALAHKDKYMDRTFKNHFADLSPIIVDQCYKFFKKRPRWQQRATLPPGALQALAAAVLLAARPALLHPDCLDFLKGVEQLDLLSNMPPVMDEGLWATMIKLRRAKIDNEMRMRAVGQDMAYVESASGVWLRALQARRALLARTHARVLEHRDIEELASRNKTVQVVLPAGQVEITTTGHMQDYEDAVLMPREDIEKINEVILKVGDMKLRMMQRQMQFRKGILAKEWEHAQAKMRLVHLQQELYSYQRLKIPKELQLYLKERAQGVTEEQDYVRMEKEMEASKINVNRALAEQVQRVEEMQLKINSLTVKADKLEKFILDLNVKVSEKRLNEDPLEPIRVRRVLKKRMETLVVRSKLIGEVQRNHSRIVLLHTELELLRLKTYPTLASFRTLN